MRKDSRLAWGVTLLLFGILYLLKQLGVFTPEISDIIYNIKNYPIYIGVVFLICYSNKNVGLILLGLGLLLRLSDIIKFTAKFSNYVWPALLIVAGAILVFGVKKGK